MFVINEILVQFFLVYSQLTDTFSDPYLLENEQASINRLLLDETHLLLQLSINTFSNILFLVYNKNFL